MKVWLILFQKELKESLRNFKWIWIPLVFILLGMLQPITHYFLPDILKSFGNLPEGVVIEIPIPTGGQVLVETLGQFNQIGILVLVLAYMGTVATERKSGTNVMVLVKPVSYVSYLTAKWVHICFISSVSFFLGFVFSYYYTHLLIETVPIANVMKGAAVYLLFLMFVMSVVICFSTLFNSAGAVAFLTIGVVAVMGIVNSLAPRLMQWSPNSLVTHSYNILQHGSVGEHFLFASVMTIILSLFLLFIAIFVFTYKEKAIRTA